MSMETLSQLVPQLQNRIQVLERDLKQSKEVMAGAIVKLVKKVKKLENFLIKKKVVLSDSEEEADEENSSKQGRNLNEAELKTPTPPKSSGETNINS
jgi:hypothetical protein